jgi:hypothetical protein
MSKLTRMGSVRAVAGGGGCTPGMRASPGRGKFT